MNATEAIGSIGFATSVFGGFACVIVVLFNMFRAVAHRKEGVPLFPHWYESPFNILFRPEQLTNRGLAARRWCFYGIIGFFVCWIVGIAIGLSTGVAQ